MTDNSCLVMNAVFFLGILFGLSIHAVSDKLDMSELFSDDGSKLSIQQDYARIFLAARQPQACVRIPSTSKDTRWCKTSDSARTSLVQGRKKKCTAPTSMLPPRMALSLVRCDAKMTKKLSRAKRRTTKLSSRVSGRS